MIDILVEYKGGGYDGCFWEWNYFYFDADGDFHNIVSTGRKGVGSEEEAKHLLMDEDNRYNGISKYNLSDPVDMFEFSDGGNAGIVSSIARWFDDNFARVILAHCYECGDELAVADMQPDNWSSDGGISYSAKDIFCASCYIANQEEDWN